MFWYETHWTGSAVRRFIRKVGLENIPPLFALRRGLQECGTRLALALACDVPLVPVPLLRFLVEEAERYDAVVPRAAGELQVLTAAYTISCLEAIDRELHSGGRAVHNLVSCVRARVVEPEELLAFGGEGVFLNINTPEDLARALAKARKEH